MGCFILYPIYERMYRFLQEDLVMHDCYVSFASAADVKEFVEIAMKQYFPVHAEQDGLKTDAKSIMSLFSMGLNRPIHVVVGETDADTTNFLSQMAPFLVG